MAVFWDGGVEEYLSRREQYIGSQVVFVPPPMLVGTPPFPKMRGGRVAPCWYMELELIGC